MATERAAVAAARSRPKILMVDDDPLAIELMRELLDGLAAELLAATDVEVALRSVEQERPHLVLLDMVLPNSNGIEFMGRIHAVDPRIRVVIVTGCYSTESAVQAIHAGAEDYLEKPQLTQILRDKAAQWIEEEWQRGQAALLDEEEPGSSVYEGVAGRTPAMLSLLSRVRRVAPHFSTALVSGATGTGKELIARALHGWSREKGPFVVCNCAAIAETLYESELFGHVRGSFTGAASDRKGLAESAHGGTLFLDEIGEMPLSVQAKLLRLVQNREIRRVGASVPIKAECRIVGATNRDLRKMAEVGQFREDLFYRLAMVNFQLPGLNERREDLMLLVNHFLRAASARYDKPDLKLTRQAKALVHRYSWPGNIRELENALSYACMLSEGELVDVHHFPEYLLQPGAPQAQGTRTLADVEYEHVLSVLKSCEGNRVRAAEVLGIGRATLYRLLASRKSVESAH